MQYKLTTPVTREDLAPLRAGDTVLLSGVVYTARDAAHKRLMERLDAGEPLPFPLEGRNRLRFIIQRRPLRQTVPYHRAQRNQGRDDGGSPAF